MVTDQDLFRKKVSAVQKYYDFGYDKVVTEQEVEEQYKHCCGYVWFSKSYEQFKKDNYITITDKNKHLFYKEGEAI